MTVRPLPVTTPPPHFGPASSALRAAPSPQTEPRASVVIPTKQRPDLLAGCLRALLAQDFEPAGWEIVVVDDGGRVDPATAGVVARAAAAAQRNGGPMVRYLVNTGRRGPAAARNLGWRVSRAEIVAFTDDDCLPDPGWLRAGAAAFVDGIAGVAGRVVLPLPPHPTDYQLDAAQLAHCDFVTASCFYRRSALQAAGGFDERFRLAWREDSDLYFTLLEQGKRLVREPAAVVLHPIRPAPWGVSVHQQKKTAYNALLRTKHPSLYRAKIKASPASYYPLTLSLLATAAFLAAGRPRTAAHLGALWVLGTAALARRRLRGARVDAGHVTEMLATSALIPPLSLFWRWYGRARYAGERP